MWMWMWWNGGDQPKNNQPLARQALSPFMMAITTLLTLSETGKTVSQFDDKRLITSRVYCYT